MRKTLCMLKHAAGLMIIAVAFLAAGCRPPAEARVKMSELRFKSQVDNVLTFDLKLRGGDWICWRHGGDDGTVQSQRWESDQATEVSVSITRDRLLTAVGMANSPTSSIPIVTARLPETPVKRDGKWLVAHYIRRMGVVETPETPLYLYVKTAGHHRDANGKTEKAGER
ncbi:MAG: hypothetical protein RRC34_04265 [Lentisphaeria bacterium]|nr:hypothetical protein [Lentisphaeria bacterium]